MPSKGAAPRACAAARPHTTSPAAVAVEQFRQHARPHAQRADRGPGATAQGETQQGRHAGRAGQAGDDAGAHALGAQCRRPLQEGFMLEHHLGEQRELDALLRGQRRLVLLAWWITSSGTAG